MSHPRWTDFSPAALPSSQGAIKMACRCPGIASCAQLEPQLHIDMAPHMHKKKRT